MGHKLPPNEKELYRRCSEVLHYVWDPIGVAGIAESRDEYDSYVPPIFARVIEKASASEIADVLDRFALENMELSPDREKSKEVARLLLAHWDRINERVARDLVTGR